VLLVARQVEHWYFDGALTQAFDHLEEWGAPPSLVQCAVVTTQKGGPVRVYPETESNWFCQEA
jgi:hypothetical protein